MKRKIAENEVVEMKKKCMIIILLNYIENKCI